MPFEPETKLEKKTIIIKNLYFRVFFFFFFVESVNIVLYAQLL